MKPLFEERSDHISSVINRVKGLPRVAFVYKLSIKEPLGIAYLSAYLKNLYPEIVIGFFDPKADKLEALHHFAPDLVLYSIMSGQYKENVKRNQFLKSVLPPFIAVFGGPHPTYFPEMVKEDGVDVICRGDGEKPLASLVEQIRLGSEITAIHGLWVKSGGTIHKNELELLVGDLDSLPFPDRELFYGKSLIFKERIAKSFFTARGCPFKCSYCYNSALNEVTKGKGKVLRYRTPQSVIQEIKEVQTKYPLPFIMFGEDVFAGIKMDWLKEFSDGYSKLNIPYNVSLRAEFVTPELAFQMKKSGCASVALAIEHGDFEYRKKHLFRQMSNKRLLDAIEVLEKNNISVTTPTMIGLPFTSFDDDIKTVELVCQAKPTYAGVTIFQPYPGLPLTDACLQNNLIEKSYVEKLNTDCYEPAYIKGIDYTQVNKLRKTFGLIRPLGYLFPNRVKEIIDKMPDNFILHHLNNLINFYYFGKIYKYRRGLLTKLKEVYVGLDTGAYGISLKWFNRTEKF
ncbi:MAG: B12-binding domain-containing radical SAM protein [Magnetococcales bacterium]|nr:B12-binding domain-containing radical SAM protein [Magnetococcales bacterium]